MSYGSEPAVLKAGTRNSITRPSGNCATNQSKIRLERVRRQAKRAPVQIVAGRSYLVPHLKGGNVMNEHDRSNQLIWGIAVIGVMFFGCMALLLSNTGGLRCLGKA